MTMNGANSSGISSAINVAPMIDVLLVLLIIFMVIAPAVPKGESALLPKLSQGIGHESEAVMLEVVNQGSDASYRINRRPVLRQDLPSRLAAIYANRAERVLFVKGDDGVSFAQVAEVIDMGHAAGVDRIGLLTQGVHAGR
jgi:biopolymer transport protein ExbD